MRPSRELPDETEPAVSSPVESHDLVDHRARRGRIVACRLRSEHGAAAVDQRDGHAGRCRRLADELLDPVQRDRGDDDRLDVAVDDRGRERRYDRRIAVGLAVHVVAEHELAPGERIVKVGAVGDVNADEHRQRRADDAAVLVDHGNVADAAHAHLEAGIEQRAGPAKLMRVHVDGRRRPQHAFDGLDHFALRLRAAPGDAGKLGRCGLDLVCAGAFEDVHPVDHQRHDKDQRHEHEARAHVENRLEFWQIAPESEARHRKSPYPADDDSDGVSRRVLCIR